MRVNWKHEAPHLNKLDSDALSMGRLKQSIRDVYKAILDAGGIPFVFTEADAKYVRERAGRLHIVLRESETPLVMDWNEHEIKHARLKKILKDEQAKWRDKGKNQLNGEYFSYYCGEAVPAHELFEKTFVYVMGDLPQRCPLLIELHLAGVALDMRLFKLIADVFRDRWLCYIPNEEEAEKHEADLIAYIIYKHGNVFELLLDKGALLSLQPVSVWQSSKPRLQSLWSRLSRWFCAGTTAFAIYKTVYNHIGNQSSDQASLQIHRNDELTFAFDQSPVLQTADIVVVWVHLAIDFLNSFDRLQRTNNETTKLEWLYLAYGSAVLYECQYNWWRPTSRVMDMICAGMLFGICWHVQKPSRDAIVRLSPVSLSYSTVKKFVEKTFPKAMLVRYGVLLVHAYLDLNYLCTRQPYRFVPDGTTIFGSQCALLPGDLQSLYSNSSWIHADESSINVQNPQPRILPNYGEQPYFDQTIREWTAPPAYNGHFPTPAIYGLPDDSIHLTPPNIRLRNVEEEGIPANNSQSWFGSRDRGEQSQDDKSTQNWDEYHKSIGISAFQLTGVKMSYDGIKSSLDWLGSKFFGSGKERPSDMSSGPDSGAGSASGSGTGSGSGSFANSQRHYTYNGGTHIYVGNGPPSGLSPEEFGRFIQDHASGRGTPQSLLGAPDNSWALPPQSAGAGQQSMSIATGFPQTAIDISEADYSKNMPAFGADGRQPLPPAQPQTHWDPTTGNSGPQSLPGDRPRISGPGDQPPSFMGQNVDGGGNPISLLGPSHVLIGKAAKVQELLSGQPVSGGKFDNLQRIVDQNRKTLHLLNQQQNMAQQSGPASAAGGQSQFNFLEGQALDKGGGPMSLLQDDPDKNTQAIQENIRYLKSMRSTPARDQRIQLLKTQLEVIEDRVVAQTEQYYKKDYDEYVSNLDPNDRKQVKDVEKQLKKAIRIEKKTLAANTDNLKGIEQQTQSGRARTGRAPSVDPDGQYSSLLPVPEYNGPLKGLVGYWQKNHVFENMILVGSQTAARQLVISSIGSLTGVNPVVKFGLQRLVLALPALVESFSGSATGSLIGN